MKKSLLNTLVGGFLLTILVTSCSTSNDVVSNSWIQKRKYNKGFYIDTKSKEVKSAGQVETLVTEEISTPAAEEQNTASLVTPAVASVTSDLSVADNNVSDNKEAVASEKKGLKILNDGLASKAFSKGKKEVQKSKEAYREYKLSDAAAVGAVGYGEGVRKNETKMWFKRFLWSAIAALVFYIIGVVLVVGSATDGGGLGIGGVFLIISYIFWVLAAVFCVIWLIKKFS